MSFSVKITGTLKSYGEQRELPNGEYTRLVEISNPQETQYDRPIWLTIYGTENIKKFQEAYNFGDLLEIDFNIKGANGTSKTTGKEYWMNNLQIWKHKKVDGTQTSTPSAAPAPAQAAPVAPQAPAAPVPTTPTVPAQEQPVYTAKDPTAQYTNRVTVCEKTNRSFCTDGQKWSHVLVNNAWQPTTEVPFDQDLPF